VPRGEEDIRQRQCVVDRLGATHGVHSIYAHRARGRRYLITLLWATVGLLLWNRERSDMPREEVAAERAYRSCARRRCDERAGLAVIGREDVGVADVGERDAAVRA